MEIYSDIRNLKGIGPKTSTILNKCGIFTILDLLLYFPRDYENIVSCKGIREAEEGEKLIIKCRVVKIKRDIRTKSRRIMSTIIFNDYKEDFNVYWFNQPYIKKKFLLNKQYLLMGKVKKIKGKSTLSNPIEVHSGALENNIIPKYPLRDTLKNSFFIKIITSILNEIKIKDNLPKWLTEKYKLCSLDEAIRNIHYPKNYDELVQAKRRLKFQELFTYSLKILMLKEYINKNNKGISLQISEKLSTLKENLPFNLTNAQSRAVREILLDQKKETSMNRLLQGDVGSGKTIVAIITLFNAVMNGYQVCFMAPTEILAFQHYEEIIKILKDYNLNIEILSGSVTNKKKESIKERLKRGKIDIIVGTHALIEDDVEFKNLGFVITDEQHRFGVMQRNKLFSKGNNVDVLVMTATPIPRTLSLYLYGDLDVSIIDEIPPGRQKIDTYYVEDSERDRVYNFVVQNIKEGRQAYIVCPLVEENEKLNLSSVEKLFNELKNKYFSDINIAILHGKMSPKDKEKIMNSFKENQIKVLISTTVIEVGINVPNANVMVVENAERFGLAQLHQLRGRVGRGKYKSYCILVANINSKTIKKRMEIMKSSNDGFYIAEEDLKIRGAGEIFGLNQSGENGLMISDIIADINILKCANKEAKVLLNSTEKEDLLVKNYILGKIKNTSKYICFN